MNIHRFLCGAISDMRSCLLSGFWETDSARSVISQDDNEKLVQPGDQRRTQTPGFIMILYRAGSQTAGFIMTLYRAGPQTPDHMQAPAELYKQLLL